MLLTNFVQNARPFSFFVGFFTGIVSMIYLFLHNEQIGNHFFDFVTFSMAVFLFSNFMAIGSFFLIESFMKKPKKTV